jgi:hexosaminidase
VPSSIVPQVAALTPYDGSLTLTDGSTLWTDPSAAPVGDLLRGYLGLALPPGKQADATLRLRVDADGLPGPEAYRLTVAADHVEVVGGGPAGVFYGVQTLRQLLPAQTFGADRAAPLVLSCLQIEDAPAFGWRGSMLDVGRHFMPKEFVFRYIDLLAMHKLNVLHLHLTEDQGWRIEIRRHPKLTEVGAWRQETVAGHNNEPRDPEQRYDGVPHGGFYTQDEIREIVAYAAERFVSVVPEIEMPGHAQAAIAAYPELGNNPDTQLPVATRWGVIKHVLNAEDSTIAFYRDVLDEVLELFPSPFIHVGGDECPKDEWQKSPAAQQRIRDLGLADEDELQSWIIRQMDDYLASRGRRLVGWDEILEGGLAPGATVMSWRGEDGGIAAAKAGHDVVMTPTTHVYFDYYQSKDKDSEPLAIGGYLPLEQVHSYRPVPGELSADEATHVLGAQCNVWTEYMGGPAQVEYMAFPRMCAFAETVWCTDRETFPAFRGRLGDHVERLRALDVGFRPLD